MNTVASYYEEQVCQCLARSDFAEVVNFSYLKRIFKIKAVNKGNNHIMRKWNFISAYVC